MKQVLLVLFTDVRHEDSVPLFHERGIEHRQSRSLLVAWTYEMIQMSDGLMPMCETETELNLVGTEKFILMKTTFISLGPGIFCKCWEVIVHCLEKIKSCRKTKRFWSTFLSTVIEGKVLLKIAKDGWTNCFLGVLWWGVFWVKLGWQGVIPGMEAPSSYSGGQTGHNLCSSLLVSIRAQISKKKRS